jgi:uncharacterized protein YigE (DUF2233 family)
VRSVSLSFCRPRLRLSAALLALAALASLALPAGAAAPSVKPAETSGPCAPLVEDGRTYTVCTIDLDRYDLRLFLNGPDGLPYGGFSRLKAVPAGHDLAMAMNAGMYAIDLSPVGLYVEDGRQLKAANTADGPGNFHLKPNGIFYVAGRQAGILETGAYLRAKPPATLATQSGPMLVINGRLHPKITQEGPSRKLRNGVGVRTGRVVVFAISDSPVSFGAFARLFRDRLGCRNALFLDGSVSSLFAPALARQDFGRPLGPIIGAVPKAAVGR